MWVGDQIDDLSTSLGVSADQIKVILLILLSLPLSLVFLFLPSSKKSSIVHIYAAVPSYVYLCHVLNLRLGFIDLVTNSVVTWLIVKVGVSRKMGKRMPWTVFAIVMGHLTINHIHRALNKTPVEQIEITGSQMVLVMKLISFAWSAYDGTRPDEELDATQRASRIKEVPSLLAFLGYCLFFPSIIAGPSFTYASYESWTTRALFAKEQAADKTGDKSDIPPGRRFKALKRLVTGLIYLGIYSTYGSRFAYFRMLDPDVHALSPMRRIGYMQIAGFVARTKYYAVWCMAESAFMLAGLGYNPNTKKYDASRNVRIRSIELAPNFKILLDSWNMNTNVWLRECIYKRLARKGKKPGFKSAQITFVTSALWHGVNPCYLMTFILGGMCQALNRSMRALVRPFFLPPSVLSLQSRPTTPAPSAPTTPGIETSEKPTALAPVTPALPEPSGVPKKVKMAAPPQTPMKWAYDIAGIIGTQLALNFAVTPFMILEIVPTLRVWASVYFYGLWIVLVPLVAINAGLAKVLKAQLRARDKRALAKEEAKAAAREEERQRLEYEKSEDAKRYKRGLGVPSLGVMDFDGVDAAEAERERRAMLRNVSKNE